MEIRHIKYYANNGWVNETEYNYTPSAALHIPRIGDMVKNKVGQVFKVKNVLWNIPTNSVLIECKFLRGLGGKLWTTKQSLPMQWR